LALVAAFLFTQLQAHLALNVVNHKRLRLTLVFVLTYVLVLYRMMAIHMNATFNAETHSEILIHGCPA